MSIKDHCFPDNEEETFSIRILLTRGTSPDLPEVMILRIRCGGPPFNPIDYYEQHKAKRSSADDLDGLLEGLDDSLGIAMIVEWPTTVVDYKTTFGVNNLTITL